MFFSPGECPLNVFLGQYQRRQSRLNLLEVISWIIPSLGRVTYCIFLSGHQFDVNGAILKALSGLKVDLGVESSVKLDDCQSASYLPA